MEKQIKVAVYEDNYALREGLTYLIKGSEMMQFAGAWGDCLDILKNCENERPDIIIMDIDMPYLSGIEVSGLSTSICCSPTTRSCGSHGSSGESGCSREIGRASCRERV